MSETVFCSIPNEWHIVGAHKIEAKLNSDTEMNVRLS